MEWIKYSDLSVKIKTVDDFDDLLKVMNTPELTEFQYLVSGDEWTVNQINQGFGGVIDENCRSYRKQKTIS